MPLIGKFTSKIELDQEQDDSQPPVIFSTIELSHPGCGMCAV